jgi:hypothetical protein
MGTLQWIAPRFGESILQEYFLSNKKPKEAPKRFIMACYHCGGNDHFGDFCHKKLNKYYPPSAFDFNDEDIDEVRKIIRRGNRRSFGLEEKIKSNKSSDRRKSFR